MTASFIRTCCGVLALLFGASTLTGCGFSSVMRLSVGTCVQIPTSTSAYSLETVPCSRPHQAEVFALPTVGGSEFPEAAQLESEARRECEKEFTSYVGSGAEDSALDLIWMTPSRESWKRGDRQIVCLAAANGDQTLRGSVRDSAY